MRQLPSVNAILSGTGIVPPVGYFSTLPPLPLSDPHFPRAAATSVAPSTPSPVATPAAPSAQSAPPASPSTPSPVATSTTSSTQSALPALPSTPSPVATPAVPSPRRPPPAAPSTPSTPSSAGKKTTAVKKKTKTVIKDPDTKALLVKLCINNFADYVKAKNKDDFYERMAAIFKERVGLDVNVKGNMYRWPQERKKELAENERKSGVSRNFNEYEQSIDKWIELTEEFEAQTEAKKKEKKEEEEQKAAEIKKVREAMKKTLAERHQASIVDLTDDGDTKKRKSDAPTKHAPAESKRRITDRIMASMKQDGEEFITAVEKIESKKMDRLERILTRALSGQKGGQGEGGQGQHGQGQIAAGQVETLGNQTALEERVNGLETKVDGIKSTLERLVFLIEEGPQ